jgi:hypothetical protein
MVVDCFNWMGTRRKQQGMGLHCDLSATAQQAHDTFTTQHGNLPTNTTAPPCTHQRLPTVCHKGLCSTLRLACAQWRELTAAHGSQVSHSKSSCDEPLTRKRSGTTAVTCPQPTYRTHWITNSTRAAARQPQRQYIGCTQLHGTPLEQHHKHNITNMDGNTPSH